MTKLTEFSQILFTLILPEIQSHIQKIYLLLFSLSFCISFIDRLNNGNNIANKEQRAYKKNEVAFEAILKLNIQFVKQQNQSIFLKKWIIQFVKQQSIDTLLLKNNNNNHPPTPPWPLQQLQAVQQPPP